MKFRLCLLLLVFLFPLLLTKSNFNGDESLCKSNNNPFCPQSRHKFGVCCNKPNIPNTFWYLNECLACNDVLYMR